MSKLTCSFFKGPLVLCFSGADQGIEFNAQIFVRPACFLPLDLHCTRPQLP